MPPARRQRRGAASPRVLLATFRARAHFRTVPLASALAARAAFCSAFFAVGLLPAFSCVARQGRSVCANAGGSKRFAPAFSSRGRRVRVRARAPWSAYNIWDAPAASSASACGRRRAPRLRTRAASRFQQTDSQMRGATPRARTLLLVVGLGRHGTGVRVQERRGVARSRCASLASSSQRATCGPCHALMCFVAQHVRSPALRAVRAFVRRTHTQMHLFFTLRLTLPTSLRPSSWRAAD